MEEISKTNDKLIPKKNKGGRPKKDIKRGRTLSVKCSWFEGKQIEIKAKQLGLSVSEYLREKGIKGVVKIKIKTLPKEVLQLCGTLNHIAANLNQIARKRNSVDELNVLERVKLGELCIRLLELVKEVKSFLS